VAVGVLEVGAGRNHLAVDLATPDAQRFITRDERIITSTVGAECNGSKLLCQGRGVDAVGGYGRSSTDIPRLLESTFTMSMSKSPKSKQAATSRAWLTSNPSRNKRSISGVAPCAW
jgi:hypothetical protein